MACGWAHLKSLQFIGGIMVGEFKGSCECGDVTYTVTGPLRPTIACHCTQCRKTSGHYWAATQVPNTHLTINKNNGLKWFRSSEWARRGFAPDVAPPCSGRWTLKMRPLLALEPSMI